MRILVSGASGLIGRALVPYLQSQGHEVVTLVRRSASHLHEISWMPGQNLDLSSYPAFDAVINLSGAGVGDKRWSDAYKGEILQSRLLATNTLVEAIAQLPIKPSVLLNASAIGFYGDRADEDLTEGSTKGSGFLSDVVESWESHAMRAESFGTTVTCLRTGLVISRNGGAFGKILPIFKFGLGGPLGTGKQFWSFISMTDEIRAIEYLLHAKLSGPVNLTSPRPLRNREVTKILGQFLRRPALVPVPSLALKIVLGEFSSDILASSKVLPDRLIKAGFVFAHQDLLSALKAELA
jgi:uncharacterized protein (TIGR01777 family)